MAQGRIPRMFECLRKEGYIEAADVLHTADGFFLVYKSVSNILAEKGLKLITKASYTMINLCMK